MSTAAITRVLKRVEQGDGCWLWPGSTTLNGYGTVTASPPEVAKRRPLLVHRVTYEHFVGPIPEGMELDHWCRKRSCCNPKHLEPVTKKTNVQRGLKSHRGLKTACVHGHAYPENAVMRPSGHVMCGACYTPGGRRRVSLD
jgi:HNH endonuclease